MIYVWHLVNSLHKGHIKNYHDPLELISFGIMFEEIKFGRKQNDISKKTEEFK